MNSWTEFNFSPSRQTLESTIGFQEMNTKHSHTSVQEDLGSIVFANSPWFLLEWSLQHGTI